ncbi:MAG: hypothetical protein VW546_09155, partial [Gammaproteobacteria bacterium]
MTDNFRWAFCLAALIILTGCAGPSNELSWGWYVISPNTAEGMANIRFLLGGLKDTVILSLVS